MHQDPTTNSAAQDAATKCSNISPFSFAPSRTNCQARTPVKYVGNMANAATDKFKYAAVASCESRLPHDNRSNRTPIAKSAIGKWMSPICCACFGKKIVRKSKGFTMLKPTAKKLSNLQEMRFLIGSAGDWIG